MKQNYHPYSYKMLAHIWSFCEQYQLLVDKKTKRESPVVIALSGGVDSMALVWIFNEFYKQGRLKYPVRAITIDHGTRKEIAGEIQGIKNYCQKLQISHDVFQIKDLDLLQSNFESAARYKRYELLQKNLKGQEVLLLGHQLDDCFEWSLMQQLKTSTLKSALGIPVRRGVIRRPLHCVSKPQIVKLSQVEKIPFFEDLSNQDEKFERNFLRANIVENVARRFPKYLKHYVQRQLQLKELLKKLSIDKKAQGKFIFKRDWGFLIFTKERISSDELKILIAKLSTKERGKLAKLCDIAVDKYNKDKKLIAGPYDFSGGVKVYQFGPFLCVVGPGLKITLKASHIPDSFPFFGKTTPKQGLKNLKGPFLELLVKASESNLALHYVFKKNCSEVLYFI